MSEPPRFETLVSFPSVFVFRAIASGEGALAAACAIAVAEELDRPVLSTETQPSRKGAYQVVRVGITVVDAEEIRRVYARLGALEGVRMVL